MSSSLIRLLLTCACALVAQLSAFAQGGATSSLSGVVVDAGGGIVPGATITVKNNATASTFETLSNSSGAFSIPVLDPGTYTVTVALDGFKTAVISDVRLLAATPGSIRAALEVGSLSETVEVKGGTELVQTQSSTVSSTITAEQITSLPLVSRNALNFVVFLPGVETSAGPRGSTISGLPQNAISVTYDGVNVNNNFHSTDGFFSMVTPRLDAVEEVTVTGATPTADQAALGAVQVAFVTRSGTNDFDGSVYHYFRHPDLNSNYYFNKIRGLERNDVVVHQYGGRIGGPIVIPGLFDGRNKAFFFFNMEEFYQPTEASRTRTILHPRAQELAVVTARILHQRDTRHVRSAGRVRLELHRRQHVRPDLTRNLTGLEDRSTTNWNIDNTMSWLRGAHSLSFGGSFMQVNHARTVWSAVPQITFGTDTNFDPANAMFSTTNLPGASTQNITDARALYGLLTDGSPRSTALRASAKTAIATNISDRARNGCG